MKEFLFEDMPPENPQEAKRTFRQLEHHIWTESKANLIQHYLQGFVFVTHHGTYMDGFAGPQNPNKHKMWAAKLVVESRPRWLRVCLNNYFSGWALRFSGLFDDE